MHVGLLLVFLTKRQSGSAGEGGGRVLTLCCVMMAAGDMLRGVGGGEGLAPWVLHGAGGGDSLAALAREGC